MNCKSCDALLKPNAKFCSKCGAKQEDQNNDSSSKDGGQVVSDTPNGGTNLSMIKQKIFWNIQPGEIARSIKEEEFLQYETAQGIIVNDGTTAYIKSNGKVIAEIHGGNYDFIPPKELDELLQKRSNGLIGLAKGAWRGLVNLIIGTSVKDNITEVAEKETANLETLDQVLEYLKRGEIFAITLKQDREFQLIFGDVHKNLDEYSNFTPLKVRAKLLDIKVGLRAFFHISDFAAFTSFYLTDTNSVRTATLADQITPIVQSILNDCLFDLELIDGKIPDNVRLRVEEKLKLNNFHGIELQKVVEISANNEDIERFRELSKELYLSEIELDYLHRSNDFINRLNTVIDDQSVFNKKRDLDIFRRLGEVNKDKLLAEDELEKFYMLIKLERDLRDSDNEDTLAEIRKNGLLRDEQIAILKSQIGNREEERGFALKLIQLGNAVQYEKTRLGGRHDIELQTVLHELNITRQKDDYSDERFHKERERKRAETSDERDDIEFLQKIADQNKQSQLDALSQIQGLENTKEDKASQRRINENQQMLDASLAKEREITERQRVQQSMSGEQIMAQNIIHGMDTEAQKEFAKSFAAGKDLGQAQQSKEEIKEILQRQEQNQKDDKEQLTRLFSEAMGKIVEAGKNTTAREEERAEEYKEMHRHEQDRHDRHQDLALNYTTRTPNTDNSKKHTSTKVCKTCNRIYDVNTRFCEDCGNEL